MRYRIYRKTCCLLVLILVLCYGSACGRAPIAESSTEADDEQEIVSLRVAYLIQTEIPAGLEEVQTRVNEILRKQIGVEINLVPVYMANAASIYAQMSASGNALDLMLLSSGASNIPYLVDNGMIMPLDDFMDQAAYMSRYMEDDLKAGVYQDRQYGIPQQTSEIKCVAKGFYLSRDICSRYNIEVDEIKTVNDLQRIFAIVHKKEPELTILMPGTSDVIADSLLPDYDHLSIGHGILVEEDEALKVRSLLEQPEVEEVLKLIHNWYNLGYIPRNVNNTDQNGVEMVLSGECFAAAVTDIGPFNRDKNGYYITFRDELPLVTTDTITNYEWVISSQCKDPASAVAFLNLCYKDYRVSNLLRYGISNVDYQAQPNGTLDTDFGRKFSNNIIQFGDPSKICMTYQTTEAAKMSVGVELPKELRQYYGWWEMRYSEAYGFSFNPESVLLEISACQLVDQQYYSSLFNGVVNPDTELDKYKQELINEGIAVICKEKQKQLDAWLAEKGN